MKAAIEQALSTSPFHMGKLYGAVWPLVQAHVHLSPYLNALEIRLNTISPTLFTKISQAILRKSFLIQAVTTIGGSANMKARWPEALQESQRYCSSGECIDIARSLLMVLLAYQTGRAQTGEFKTNRELRWEAHPRSTQFAIYSACAHIEHKLICQICDFAWSHLTLRMPTL